MLTIWFLVFQLRLTKDYLTVCSQLKSIRNMTNKIKLVLAIYTIIYSTSINAHNVSFLDNSYTHTYDNCKVSFANVNSCFNIAHSIYLNSFCHQVDSNLWGCPYMSKWQLEILKILDKEKYQSEELVTFCSRFHDKLINFRKYTYFGSYQNGKLMIGEKPFKYEGDSDSLQKFLIIPLEQFKGKLVRDTSLIRFNSSIESYMDSCSATTQKIFTWIHPKSVGKVSYLYAEFAPFDDNDVMNFSMKSDTLYIYGNNVYEPESNYDCYKSTRTEYPVFEAITGGILKEFIHSRDLLSVMLNALYFEYLEETKSDIKDVEKESVRCIYRKYNYRIGEKSIDEFVSDFHSLYKKKKYRNNLEKLCAKILDDYNKVK